VCAAYCLAAQQAPRHRVGVSGAWTREAGGYSFEKRTAPGLGATYGYRFLPFMEAEAGFFTALDPTGDVCSRFGCFDAGDRFYWITPGVRFIAPRYLGRIEFSGGGGALYEKYDGGSAVPGGGPYSRHGWGGYFVASTAVALDRQGHFWLAATPRLFLANPAYARDRWFQLSGEFIYRFR
jgi:hypothetical protein